MSDQLTTINIGGDGDRTEYAIPQGETALDDEAILHATIRRARRNGRLPQLRQTIQNQAATAILERQGRPLSPAQSKAIDDAWREAVSAATGQPVA